MPCRMQVPQPGIEPMPPAVEAWSLNHRRQGSPIGGLSVYQAQRTLSRNKVRSKLSGEVEKVEKQNNHSEPFWKLLVSWV